MGLHFLCSVWYAVLGSFLATLNLFCEERYGISHDLDEFFAYDFMKVRESVQCMPLCTDSSWSVYPKSSASSILHLCAHYVLQIWKCSQEEGMWLNSPVYISRRFFFHLFDKFPWSFCS